MTTLRDYMAHWGHAYTAHTGEIGIEVETEALRDYRIPQFKFWTAHVDGSLRNIGREYVLSSPLNYGSKQYTEALTEFEQFVKGVKFEDSSYTSVHVHLNMLDFNIVKIFNFISTYILFEEVLTRYCGPDRDGNLFCLKTSNAERNLAYVHTMIDYFMASQGNNGIRNLSPNAQKYAGLNISPLRNFGSLEVRTHPGTVDVVLIDRWVRILYCIYEYSKKLRDPLELLEKIKNSSRNSLLIEVFGDFASFLPEFTKEDLDVTLWYVSSIATRCEDWSKIDSMEKKPKAISLKKRIGEPATFAREDLNTIYEALTRPAAAPRVPTPQAPTPVRNVVVNELNNPFGWQVEEDF